jgi:hypothetical protein
MTLFTDKAPWIMNLLRADFDLTVEEAAAILGNIGHESGGFKYFQEIKPVVPGSRGGFGWCQWTGPRRVAFEGYCKRNKLDPFSDKANYGFLLVELRGTEKAAIPALKKAKGLERKVAAFEAKFERAGVVNMPSRMRYANQALAAWKANQGARPPYAIAPSGKSDTPEPPVAPAPAPQSIPTPPVDDPMPVPPIEDAPEKTPLTFMLGVGFVFVALAAFAVLKFLGKI